MKIAQVVCVYPPYRGGIGKAAEANSIYLKNRGFEVTVFTPLYDNLYKNTDADVKYLKAFLKFGNAALLPGLFNNLQNFDLVILHYPFFGSTEIVFLSRLLHKKNPKLIIHYHMDVTNLGLIKSLFCIPSRLIRSKLFGMADAIICSSFDYVRTGQLQNIYKSIPKKFVEIPFSVDETKFFPQNKTNNEFIDILFVGGMDKAHNFKGVDVLIKAFAKIHASNIRLNLVGNGSLIEYYKNLCTLLKIENRVRFYCGTSNNQLIDLYQASDIFVLPSINTHEAFGIVLLEAMSSGLPVIATNLPGVRTVFVDGQQGFYAKPNDIDDLKSKIEYLIENPQKRIEMGDAGRKLVLAKYCLNKNIDKFNHLVQSVL